MVFYSLGCFGSPFVMGESKSYGLGLQLVVTKLLLRCMFYVKIGFACMS